MNKHTFSTGEYNIIIEHEKPFSKFTALKILSKHLRTNKNKTNLAKN